jgi:ATP-dependent Clp protease ATP-binding subunit ClpC
MPMSVKLTSKARQILTLSKKVALKTNSTVLKPLHILISILQDESCLAYKLLLALGVSIPELRNALEAINYAEEEELIPIARDHIQPHVKKKLTAEVEKLLKMTQNYAAVLHSDVVGTEYILLAVIRNADTAMLDVLSAFHINHERIEHTIVNRLGDYYIVEPERPDLNNEIAMEDRDNQTGKRSPENPLLSKNIPSSSTQVSQLPALNSYGRDLSKLAEEGQLDPIIARQSEIERMVQILSRRRKNNVLLIGEPGVGKTAIAEGLALQIAQGKVVPSLRNKRIVMIDMAALVAGTKYRGQFEERLKLIMNEVIKTKTIILFIDEFHTLVGAGGAAGALDAANILKPALARGDIQCIGATTLNEYRQYIEKDGALTRRFQNVTVEPSGLAQSVEILTKLQPTYEAFHRVSYTPEIIQACVDLSDRYITNRLLPDKAIDVLDEAGASVHIRHMQFSPKLNKLIEAMEQTKEQKNEKVKSQQYEEAAKLRDQEKKLHQKFEIEKAHWEKEIKVKKYPVTLEDVAAVVSHITGIPAKRISQQADGYLLHLQAKLKTRIIGQDMAIDKVVKTIQRTHIGLQERNRPLGVFMFLGPTGVGKTELAKTLASVCFSDKGSLIRIDMSEYMDKFTVSKLIGAPPGYIGYEEGGQLTEKIRKYPYSVVLLDETEKAHPDVYNILLQMMDDGILTDGLGRKIDCRQLIIIMTSNVGAADLQQADIGFQGAEQGSIDERIREKVQRALKRTFNPEFINRLDEVIIFRSLTQADVRKIVDLQLNKLLERVEKIGYHLIIKPKAKRFVAEKGFDPQYGIRPLKRTIQQHIEDPITEKVLAGEVGVGNTIVVDYTKGKSALTISILSL